MKLCNTCFNENTSIEFAKESFSSTMNDKNQIYLIGILNDEIIAHAKIAIIPTMFEEMNTYAILNHVCVKPEFRKLKIATHMLDIIDKICKSRGCVSIKLWSNNYRDDAHGLYHSYGFEKNDASFFSREVI